jgi:hypothetical protein
MPNYDDQWTQLTLEEAAPPARESAAPHRSAADAWEAPLRHVLGITPETARDQIPEQVKEIHQKAMRVQARLDEIAGRTLPGERSPSRQESTAGVGRAAILQPPQPEIVPAARVLEQYRETVSSAAEPERG